jgi:hypothetical protein
MLRIYLPITNYQLPSLLRRSNFGYEGRINYQLPFINVVAKWQMLNDKLLANGKCEIINALGGTS